MNGTKRKCSYLRWIIFGVGIVICVFFGFLLLCNIVIIVKSHFRTDIPPSVFGFTPMVVKSGSMSGTAPDHIEVDDLIFIGKANKKKLQVGDIIAFMSDDTMVTHRISEILTKDNGDLLFITKGDANNVTDDPISENKVIGIFLGRIPKIGRLIVFLQSHLGVALIGAVTFLSFTAVELVIRPNRRTHKF